MCFVSEAPWEAAHLGTADILLFIVTEPNTSNPKSFQENAHLPPSTTYSRSATHNAT